MPTFSFRAVDGAGRRQSGRVSAADAAALTRTLEARGLVVLDVAERADAAGAGGGWFRPGQRREVLEVTRALAALLPVGMPLAHALGAAANVATGDVRAAVAAARARVERGDPLAVALAEHGRFFPPLYVGLVRAGEQSGDVAGAFARLAAQLERDGQLRGRLVNAAVYPLVLLAAGTGAVGVLLFFVLPRFADLLRDTGATLPRSTALVLGASDALRRGWPALAALALGAAVLAGWARRTPAGRRAVARALLALPVVGAVRRQALGARFARLAGVLLGGGAPLLPALDGTAESLADPVAQDEVRRVRARVREGRSLRDALEEGDLFPPLVAQLVGVGEDAGRLREFLLKAAEILEEQTERLTQRVATLAEPAMILVFGSLVGLVALSLLQAVYGLNAGSFR